MPMSLLTYLARILAFSHVQQRVSDYFAGENRVWEAILISS